MDFISSLFDIGMYSFVWLVISSGVALIIAAAFFGIREEKNLEENQDDL